MTARPPDDHGFVTAFVAILAVALLTFAGLVYDGGQILNRYRQASDLAANAARAGAQEVDRASIHAGAAEIDAERARHRVIEFLAAAGHPGSGRVSVGDDQITVTVTLDREPYLVPFGPRRVAAQASATLVEGVDRARTGGA